MRTAPFIAIESGLEQRGGGDREVPAQLVHVKLRGLLYGRDERVPLCHEPVGRASEQQRHALAAKRPLLGGSMQYREVAAIQAVMRGGRDEQPAAKQPPQGVEPVRGRFFAAKLFDRVDS